MKKNIIIAFMAAAVAGLSSCGNSKLTEEEARNHRLDDSLRVALANADSLFSLLYDVTTGMDQITKLENLMNTQLNTESASARENIARQMEAIQKGLIERRKRIAELEDQLAKHGGENGKLRKQIDMLNSQIDAQAASVLNLRTQLETANIRIAELDSTVVRLNSTVDTIQAARADTERQLAQAVDDLNSVYYVIGTSEQLKEHNIIEGGGFLRKTKVLPSDFDQSYMTRADRRSLTVIPLDAKKAKVMTNQPKESYRIDKADNEMLSLVILDPAKFWAVSNILVVEVKI